MSPPRVVHAESVPRLPAACFALLCFALWTPPLCQGVMGGTGSSVRNISQDDFDDLIGGIVSQAETQPGEPQSALSSKQKTRTTVPFQWIGRYQEEDTPVHGVTIDWILNIDARKEFDASLGGHESAIYSIRSASLRMSFNYYASKNTPASIPVDLFSETYAVSLTSADFDLSFDLEDVLDASNPDLKYAHSFILDAKPDMGCSIFLKYDKHGVFTTPRGSVLHLGGAVAGPGGGFSATHAYSESDGRFALWPDGADFISPAGYFNVVGPSSLDRTRVDEVSCSSSIAVTIARARMVSRNELGVDLGVTVPKSDPRGGPWKIKFSGRINGQDVDTDEYDISDLVDPGDSAKSIRFDVGDDPREVNLEQYSVPRFTKSQKFDLTATLVGPNGQTSDTEEVVIPLPVIFIHGVSPTNWAEIVKSVPYDLFRKYLTRNGYSTGGARYRTLWGPPEVQYSSQDHTAKSVSLILHRAVDRATAVTYADKVNLVGHSLGGLIGRYYAWGDPERVHKVIMIGTPNQGSVVVYADAFRKSRSTVEKLLHVHEKSHNPFNLRSWLSPGQVYTCLRNKATKGEIANPFPSLLQNFFYSSGYNLPAPGDVRYYSIYNANPRSVKTLKTPLRLDISATKGWYTFSGKRADQTFGVGDGSVLAEKAALPPGMVDSHNINVPVEDAVRKHGVLPGDPKIRKQVLWALEDGEYEDE